MKISFSPPDMTQAEAQAAAEAILSGWITTGPKTKEFERRIAARCGTPMAVCLNSQTACGEMALRLLEVGPGDEVIVPAYTYTATASVVCHVGAKLVMVDCRKDSLQMDYDALEAAITEKTKVVVIDDCQRDFDFEQLFGLITGEWPVDPKNEKPFTLPFSISPKIYITTNHAIGGDGGSFEARQWCLAFSDFYSAEHEPKDDFKTRFFSEWDFEQWNLFWNLVAQCVQIYFRFGYVPAPGSRLKERKLIQDIGEDFIMWADEYFSAQEHFNTSLVKKTVYADFVSDIGPAKAKFYTTTRFKAKVIKYCELRGFIFNPQFYDPVTKKCLRFDKDNRPDPNNDKRNSLEYITVGDNSFYVNTPTLWPDGGMDEHINTGDEEDGDLPE